MNDERHEEPAPGRDGAAAPGTGTPGDEARADPPGTTGASETTGPPEPEGAHGTEGAGIPESADEAVGADVADATAGDAGTADGEQDQLDALAAGAGPGTTPRSPADEDLPPPAQDAPEPTPDDPAAAPDDDTTRADAPDDTPADEAPGGEPGATGTAPTGTGTAGPAAPDPAESRAEAGSRTQAGERTTPPRTGGRRLWHLFRPRNRRAEYLTAALCVAFGFALAVQVAQSTGDQLASLRQDELVRLLDEVTQRGEQLDTEVTNLTEVRDDLLSADGQDRAARELAEQRAEYEGILSGRLPAQGPGVVVEIQAQPGTVTAANMFNMLEELRNAGVEAQQVNDVRIVTSSHFEETVDEDHRILLDGRLLEPPYRWVAVGDPATVDRALEIPGGALPTLRDAGATAEVTRQDEVMVDATRTPADPEYAEPSEE